MVVVVIYHPSEEKNFLRQFIDSAHKGLITTITQIKRTYESQIGQTVHRSSIYRLLERHGWGKVMPGSHHSQTNFEEQQEFKQQFPHLVNEALKTKEPQDERPILIMAQDEGRNGAFRSSNVELSFSSFFGDDQPLLTGSLLNAIAS